MPARRRPRDAPPPTVLTAVPAVRAPPVPVEHPIVDLPAWLATVDEYLALAGVGLTDRQQRILGAAIGELAKDEEVARRVALALIRAFELAGPRRVEGRPLKEMKICYLLGSDLAPFPQEEKDAL